MVQISHADWDTVGRGVNNLTVTDIHRHVGHPGVISDQVPRLQGIQGHRRAVSDLCLGGARDGFTGLSVCPRGQTRTVKATW